MNPDEEVWPGTRARHIEAAGWPQISKRCAPGDLVKLTKLPAHDCEECRFYNKWDSNLIIDTFVVRDTEIMFIVSIANDHHDFLEDFLVLCSNGRLGWINSQNIEKIK